MTNKFTKKQFIIKSGEFGTNVPTKNSIIFQHYDKNIDFGILYNKSLNIPVFHNDNNIEILDNFIETVSIFRADTYSKIYLIIDDVCFVALINKTHNNDNKILSNNDHSEILRSSTTVSDYAHEQYDEPNHQSADTTNTESNESLYISYKNVTPLPIINSIIQVSFDNSYRNMMLFTVSGFIIGFITKHLLTRRH